MVWDFFLRFVILARSGTIVRRIAWLTMLGLTISISSLILVLSIMSAMNRSQKERTLAAEPHLTLEFLNIREFKFIRSHPAILYLEQEMGDNPKNEIVPYESQDVIVRTLEKKFRGAVIRGLTWEGLKRLLQRINPKKTTKTKAELPFPEENRPQKGEIYMGADLAHSLGVFEGDQVLIIPPEFLLLSPSEVPKFEKVKVKTLLVTNIAEVDGEAIYYVAGETMVSLNSETGGASRKLGVEVRLSDVNQVDALKQQLAVYSNVLVETWEERNSALFFALKLEKAMIGIFLCLASMIAGLSMLSVISLVISQKTNEIGLLQAIGYSRNQVKELFSKIGFLLGAFGVLGGIGIGGLLSFYLQQNPLNILPDIYYDSQIPAELQPRFIFIVLVVGLLFSYLGSAYVVRRSVENTPSVALRGKR